MIRSLYWEQHPPSTAGLQVLLFVPRTFCKSKSGSGCDVFVLFCDVIRCAFGPLRVAPVVASRVASGMVPSLFVPSPNRRRHPLSSCCICKRVCVCVPWLGRVPSFSPCPCHPYKDAITQSLATVAWAPLPGFVPANKWAISVKSSETGLTAVDHDSSQTPSSIAPVPPRLQAGTVPVDWHATAGVERNKQSNSGQRRGSSTVLLRSYQM